MRKSDHYNIAIMAVIEHRDILTAAKIEVLETLMDDKRTAEWSEKREAEKNADLS